jgi:hypothetical protein
VFQLPTGAWLTGLVSGVVLGAIGYVVLVSQFGMAPLPAALLSGGFALLDGAGTALLINQLGGDD